MGNCKSCILSKTSDDLDGHNPAELDRTRPGSSKSIKSLQNANKHSTTGSKTGSVNSNKSLSTANERPLPAIPVFRAQDDSKESSGNEEVVWRSFKRKSGSRISIRAGLGSDKKNTIQVKPMKVDAYKSSWKVVIDQLSKFFAEDEYDLENFEDICSIMWSEGEHLKFNTHYKFSRKYGMTCNLNNDFYAEHPIYSTFRELLELYSRGTGGNHRKAVEDRFLEQVMETRVMEICWAFLNAANYFSSARNEFKKKLRSIWFPDAFEHIFVGSNDGDRVSGMHNWLRFAMEQENGNITYIKCLGQIPGMVAAIKYEWNGDMKDKGSMFIGTSPQFELALYTLLYFQSLNDGLEENTFSLDFDDLMSEDDTVEIWVRIIVCPRNRTLKTAYPMRPNNINGNKRQYY